MEEIRLYHRATSPFIQAEITVAPEYKIRVSTKTTCENEAQRFAYKKYIEAKTRFDLGIRDEHTTFGQAYTKWEKRSLKTIHNTYMQWVAPRWGREPLSKITSVQLQRWFDDMALGSSRKGDIARIVRGVFEKAVQIKIISKAPSFKIVADPENPRPHFTDEEIRQVLDRLPGWCEGKNWRRATLLNFVVQVLLGTGLRPGNETTMLRWTDFQIWSVKDGKPRYKLRIRPETNKTARGREVVFDSDLGYVIDMKLRMQLIDWDCYDANGYMFCTERGTRVNDLDKLFAQFLSDIGLQENDLGQKRTLYSLRHTYCTRKLIQGVPPHILAKQTGHSVNILLRWYSKATPVDWADILTSRS